MGDLAHLIQFVRENYPEYAYIATPEIEVAVDGLIFRPNPAGGLLFISESGEQALTLQAALQMLQDDILESF